MKEGPVEYFKWHQIIFHHEKFYVYDATDTEIGVFDSNNKAKQLILDKICFISKKDIEHNGVEILLYDYEDRTYIMSVKKEIFEEFPQFKNYTYHYLLYRNKKWLQYLHNERGPSNICLESKAVIYFWHGQKLSKEQWEKAVRDMNFNSALDDFLDEK